MWLKQFEFDERLGILIPALEKNWRSYDRLTQEKILLQWEQIRGNIPEQVFRLEQEINQKQAMLNNEANFIRACDLNTKISELASIINDLWLWFRSHEAISEKNHN